MNSQLYKTMYTMVKSLKDKEMAKAKLFTLMEISIKDNTKMGSDMVLVFANSV